MSGTVTSTLFPDYHVQTDVAPGDAITGVFTYDPDGESLQGPPSSFDFQVGQLRLRSSSQGVKITAGLATGPTGPSFTLQNGGLGSTVTSDPRLQDVFTLMQLQHGPGTLNVSGLANGAPSGPAQSFGIGGTITAVAQADLAPEPSSLALMLPGVAGLALLRRKKPGHSSH